MGMHEVDLTYSASKGFSNVANEEATHLPHGPRPWRRVRSLSSRFLRGCKRLRFW